jgi:hypothetical protein
MIKHLVVFCQFLSIFGGVFSVLVGDWFTFPIAACLLLGFIMWELHLNGVEGWCMKKELDYHRRN